MYYQPENKPHFMTKLSAFLAPRNRYNPMNIAYCSGGKTLNHVEEGMLGYVWKAYIENETVYLQREDLEEVHTITQASGITQIDLTFDQNMRPFLCYVKEGLPYYYHFNPDTSMYSEVALDPTITFPRCALDMPDDIINSDIYIGYTRAGNLCYRLQRERFLQEHIIATDPKKSMLWRIGRTVDNRFGYHWR